MHLRKQIDAMALGGNARGATEQVPVLAMLQRSNMAHGLWPVIAITSLSGMRWSCRTGVCHTCECGLISRAVKYDPGPLERPAAGNLLTCCSRPGEIW